MSLAADFVTAAPVVYLVILLLVSPFLPENIGPLYPGRMDYGKFSLYVAIWLLWALLFTLC